MKSFKQSSLLLAAILAASPGGLAQTNSAPTAPSGPQIEFDTADADWGRVIAGDIVKHTFTVSNTGDATLEIADVHPGCGCTSIPAGWPHSLAPHQSGTFTVQVDTSHLGTGPISKSVSVRCNDKSRPMQMVAMHGIVWIPYEVSPQPAAYLNVEPNANAVATTVLKIINRVATPLLLSAPVVSTNVFTAVLKTNTPGQEYELTITAATPPGLPATTSMLTVQGMITLKTSSLEKPLLEIPAYASIQPELMLLPAQLVVPAGVLPAPATNWITLRANTAAPITLSDAKINVPGATIEIRMLQAHREYQLVVTLPQGYEMKPGENVTATVASDNPRFPTIRVPVIASPKSLPTPLHSVPGAPARLQMLQGNPAHP